LTKAPNTYALFRQGALKVRPKITNCPTFDPKRAIQFIPKNISGSAQRVSRRANSAAKRLLGLLRETFDGPKILSVTSSGSATNVLICRDVATKLIKKATPKITYLPQFALKLIKSRP